MKLVDQNTCLPLFHKSIIYTKLARWKMSHFTEELMFSSIPFSYLQYENGRLEIKIRQSTTMLSLRNS